MTRRDLLAGAAAGVLLPPAAGATPAGLAADVGLLARGFNAPGWIEAGLPDRGALASLRAAGLTHVRLPVPLERLSGAFSDRAVVASTCIATRAAVRSLLEGGYAVSVDLHPDGGFNDLHLSRPNEGLAVAVEAWDALVPFLLDLPWDRVLLEILNEPVVERAVWGEQGPLLAAAVRARAPRHTIIYPPHLYQRIEALLETRPLEDPNVVYAVHYYDPMAFTHQGADWGDANDPLRHVGGLIFPGGLEDASMRALLDRLRLSGRSDAVLLVEEAYAAPWDAQRIEAAFGHAGAWSRAHRRKVILNEFGVLRWRAAPRDRRLWLSAVRRAAEAQGLGWAHWDYADGFGLAERTPSGDDLDRETLRALLA